MRRVPSHKNQPDSADKDIVKTVPRVETAAAVTPRDEDEDADLVIHDEYTPAPVARIVPGPPEKNLSARTAPVSVFDDLNPAPAPANKHPEEVSSVRRRKNVLTKRNAAPLNEFRHVLRPKTAMSASEAVDSARAESPSRITGGDATDFRQVHKEAPAPDFRPNKLHGVLNSAYRHTRLGWLNWLDRIGPISVIVAVLLLSAGGFLGWRYFSSLSDHVTTSSVSPDEAKSELPLAERLSRGRKTVEQFLAAQTDAARLPLVMDPDRAAPRMKQFYGEMGGRNPALTTWEVGAPVTSPHGEWLPFVFTDITGRKVTVPLGETEDGCILDWENFTAFGDLPWAEFCRSRPTTPRALRVRMRRADQYTSSFDRAQWQAYEIEHRTGGPKLITFANRAGRYFQGLDELVKGDGWQCALLYLRFDPSSGTPVVEGIVRTRWQDEATSWTGP